MQFLENKPYYRNHHLQRGAGNVALLLASWKRNGRESTESSRIARVIRLLLRFLDEGEILKISRRFGEIDTSDRVKVSI